jgi:hypothetical protein
MGRKTRAYVIFRTTRIDPISALTRDGFDHVDILFCDYEFKTYGILATADINKTVIKPLLFKDVEQYFKKAKRKGNKVLYGIYECNRPLNRFINLMPNNCVMNTKNLLGIRNMFIWTPYQLYKYLIKNNFYEVNMSGGLTEQQEKDQKDQDALTAQMQLTDAQEKEKTDQETLQNQRNAQGGSGFSNTLG